MSVNVATSPTTEESSVVPALAAYIATRDKACAKETPWSPEPLKESFSKLLRGETVVMGGRASCGSSCDPTWKRYRRWKEVVRKAGKIGYRITEVPIPQKNGWATKAGGFWEENEYSLLSEASKDQPND